MPVTARPLIGLAVLALALTAPSAAFAQASPSAGTYAVRYDLLRREVGTITPDPDGAGPLPFLATRKTYSAAGHLTKVETGTLASWQSESVAPAAWTGFALVSQVDTAYDDMGRKVHEAASGNSGGTIVTTGVTEYGYDLAGRLKCTAVRMNPDVWATPLPDEQKKCVPGPAHAVHGPDRITRNSYTVHGEILKVERAVGTGLQQVYASYTYSPNGKPVSVTDANGNRAEMSYDGLDRQKRWIFPSTTSPGAANPADYEEYSYDANANRTSLRKRDGSQLTYQYDALNRMTVKIVPERSGLASTHTRDVYYDYDLRGLQTKARFDSLAGEGITNVYDGFGLLVSSTSNMAGVARATGNLYDFDGNRIRVIHPDTSFFTYEVDGLGRPTWIRENGGAPVATFAYDAAGRRATSGWAATTSYGYDPVGRLQTLSHDLGGTSRDHVLGFTYNPASQIQGRSASNDSYAWGGSSTYVRSYAANGLNQYTGATSTGAPAVAFGYDLNGNLTSDGSHAFVYDVENRLLSATGAHNAELAYDPLGRLFQVSSGGAGIRRLVYDGDALVAEYDSAGNMPHRYIHGNDPGADDPLVWYDNFAAGWRRALLTDHQGSVIQVADMYGYPVATNTYDPWGIPGAANAGRFGYTGQTWVPELGLWYYKARFYSPTTGRFLQVDPVGYEAGINLYAYVANDPVNRTDPTGLADLNLVRPSDTAFPAAEMTDYQGAFTIVGHSNFLDDGRHGVEDQRVRGNAPVLAPRELLAAAEAKGYHRGGLTFLLSCGVGIGGKPSFAQEYANLSGGRVIASPGLVGVKVESATSVRLRSPDGFFAYDRNKMTPQYLGNRIVYNPKTGVGVIQVQRTGSLVPNKVRVCMKEKCDP